MHILHLQGTEARRAIGNEHSPAQQGWTGGRVGAWAWRTPCARPPRVPQRKKGGDVPIVDHVHRDRELIARGRKEAASAHPSPCHASPPLGPPGSVAYFEWLPCWGRRLLEGLGVGVSASPETRKETPRSRADRRSWWTGGLAAFGPSSGWAEMSPHRVRRQSLKMNACAHNGLFSFGRRERHPAGSNWALLSR